MSSLEFILPPRSLALHPDWTLFPPPQRESGSGSSGISKAGTVAVGRAERQRHPNQTDPGSKSILRCNNSGLCLESAFPSFA